MTATLTGEQVQLLTTVLRTRRLTGLDSDLASAAQADGLIKVFATNLRTGQKFFSLSRAAKALMQPHWSELPWCLRCGCTEPGKHNCSAEPTYPHIGAGERRLWPCTCELPCDSYPCPSCNQDRPWCFGEENDPSGWCGVCSPNDEAEG